MCVCVCVCVFVLHIISFYRHYADMLRRIEYWCMAFRRDLMTRGHGTNNFSEANMRIFKEVILERYYFIFACGIKETFFISMPNFTLD